MGTGIDLWFQHHTTERNITVQKEQPTMVTNLKHGKPQKYENLNILVTTKDIEVEF